MSEDRRSVIPEPERIALRPDQAPPLTVDDIAAIKAVMNAKATGPQQAWFVQYLLSMTGVVAGEQMMSSEAWAFNAGKRWVGATLLSIAEVRLVTLGARKAMETENG